MEILYPNYESFPTRKFCHIQYGTVDFMFTDRYIWLLWITYDYSGLYIVTVRFIWLLWFAYGYIRLRTYGYCGLHTVTPGYMRLHLDTYGYIRLQ